MDWAKIISAAFQMVAELLCNFDHWEGSMLKNSFVEALPGEQKAVIERVLSAALDAADPRQAVARALALDGEALLTAGERLDLRTVRRVRVIGAGKASQAMARGLVDVLGARISDGVIISKHQDKQIDLPPAIRVLLGGHPVPTADSISSTQALADLLVDGQPDDLIICLISGGGSALMSWPEEGTSLAELQELTRLLLACGADIGEINTLRKHLDRVKGGGLARLASPARLVTLILSDVIGSPLDVIASGPTVADSSTYAQAQDIVRKYRLEDRVPPGIASILERGTRGEIAETVKPGDPVVENVINQIIASNPQAASAALAQARRDGFHTLLLTTYLQGEASQVGIVLASLLQQIHASADPLPRPACIVAGGETTVTLHGQGLGGRNQEMALGAVFLLSGLPDVALITLGTDGEDGPTDAAGAVVTGKTLQRARALELNPLAYLQSNDSYHFFSALGDLIQPGPTGTNVNDLVFLFAF
jgi:glycerate 2-kinase